MVTGRQIHAGRALMGLDATKFAKKVGLTRETIFNIEHSVFRPRPATLDKILEVFDANNVELIGERGAALRHDMITMYEGAGYYVDFLGDVYNFCLKNKSEVLFFNVDDSISTKEVTEANQRLIKAGIRCRYLCSEKPKAISFKIDNYRGIPGDQFRNGLLVVYGDRLGTLVRGKAMLVIRNEDLAEGMKNLFNLIWNVSKKPVIEHDVKDRISGSR